MSITPLAEWFNDDQELPIIIAGPCSAESREQILDTARELAKLSRVSIFRAGVWKPRSRPGAFQGIGEPALEWLIEAKQETGLRLAVEVATPLHVDLALKNGVDVLWIGARTLVNPFSTDQLAASLTGVDTPILIKNPIHPDLELWIGTIERFAKAGIKKLGAIHRGFSPFHKSQYRNIPKWEVPIDLKTHMPNLPIICDPSHIAGKPGLIREISQKALDLSMDGLMIESHINPKVALSDAKQQVKPDLLGEILESLSYRRKFLPTQELTDVLESLREEIDSLDHQLLDLLSQRMAVVSKIGEYKKENNVAIMQLRRWEEMISTRVEMGKLLGLQEDFVKDLLRLVHKESIHKQVQILGQEAKKR